MTRTVVERRRHAEKQIQRADRAVLGLHHRERVVGVNERHLARPPKLGLGKIGVGVSVAIPARDGLELPYPVLARLTRLHLAVDAADAMVAGVGQIDHAHGRHGERKRAVQSAVGARAIGMPDPAAAEHRRDLALPRDMPDALVVRVAQEDVVVPEKDHGRDRVKAGLRTPAVAEANVRPVARQQREHVRVLAPEPDRGLGGQKHPACSRRVQHALHALDRQHRAHGREQRRVFVVARALLAGACFVGHVCGWLTRLDCKWKNLA